MFELGRGVEYDIERAMQYYLLGAEKEEPFCLCSLGRIYFYGKFVEIDYKKAHDYFARAIKKGNNLDSYYCLGDIYQHGKGVEININKALEYYKKASSLGNDSSLLNLGFIGTEVK